MPNDGYGYNGGGAFPFPVQQPQAPQANRGGQGPDWGGNFSGNLNDMLAPYQQIAQRISSPYATMSPNSWLAQKHPQLAGTLDNAFLGMGMTPQAQGPEGFGGGVSRMFQGLIGAQQYRKTQALDSAMLPYKMAMGQLQATDVMSQINERNAMVPFRQAQENRYDAQSAMYYDKMAHADNPKAMAGPDMTDDKGHAWSRIFDPTTGRVRNFNSELGKYSDELPAGSQPTFANQAKNQHRAAAGGLLGEIMDMQDSTDPAVRAIGDKKYGEYITAGGAMAAARAGATQSVTQPVKDLYTFVRDERTNAFAGLPKPMNAEEFTSANLMDPKFFADNLAHPGQQYQAYIKQYQASRERLGTDLDKYQKSDAPKKNVSFSEYMKNRTMYDGTPSAIASPSTQQSKPSIIKYKADGTRE